MSLTVLYGPPAAGKTTYAQSQRNATHIDLDQLAIDGDGAVLAGGMFNSSASVWRHAQALAAQALRQREPVIFDYFAVQRVYRYQLRLLARRARVPARLVIIDATLDECLARNRQRTDHKRLPDTMIRELYDQYLDDRDQVTGEPWASVTTMPARGATSHATT